MVVKWNCSKFFRWFCVLQPFQHVLCNEVPYSHGLNSASSGIFSFFFWETWITALDKREYQVNICLISLRKHMLWYSEAPCHGAFNENSQHVVPITCFMWKNKKITILFGWKKMPYIELWWLGLQGFPWLTFWKFLPPKPCSGPLKVRRKGLQWCRHNQIQI